MDLLDRLLGHDQWTTQQLLLRCRELTSPQLHRRFDIGHETVWNTLDHMLGNIRVWTDLMAERPVRLQAEQPAESLDDFITQFDALYADFAACARMIAGNNRLDATYKDVLDDPPMPKTFGGTILHVITHNMHHRGEVLHMFARLGLPHLPEGDMLSWEHQARAASIDVSKRRSTA
jgi:uncharacterized damage-inducible protein DinB